MPAAPKVLWTSRLAGLRRAFAGRLAAGLLIALTAGGPLVSVAPDGGGPAEATTEVGRPDADDVLTAVPAWSAPNAGHSVQLGAFGVRRSVPSVPFLEVPENPPELG
jgi:hypothetical protein